jgi:hypothetical protein
MSDPTVETPAADTTPAAGSPPAVDPVAQRQALMAAALKQKVPLAVLDPTCQWTDSKDQAAVTGLNNATQVTQGREMGGAIFQNPQGQYCYSIPVGGTQDSHFHLRAQSTPEQQLVGIFHTHPAGSPENSTFSPDDVKVANQLKLTSYIKALQSGAVKRYDPGVTPTQSVGSGLSSFDKKSPGTLVPQ